MATRMASIADAMESPEAAARSSDVARNFRLFAERTGNDLGALAAMQRSPRAHATKVDFAGIALPVLVLVGEDDVLIGKADKLVAAIPGAKLVYTPGDHLTAVAKPEFTRAIIDFLAERSPVSAH
jgi:pimeloyl-ACP methyl ester carboxylesterase